jgi:sarcosine oxidase
MTIRNSYDAIVVGVGGMGSATVYHLARAGLSVLGLEQFDIPHEHGSSHGVNRIIRLAYFENPAYVPLLRRAYELWRQIEDISHERLLVITGSIDAGYESESLVAGSLLACKEHHLPYELLDAAGVNRRFPGYRLNPEMAAVYQPDGGFVLCERAIVTYVMAALDLGADVHAREPVLGWKADASGVCVRTQNCEYRGRRLVLTAGPWISKLLLNLRDTAVPERQVLIWVHPKKPDLFRLGTFPVFNLRSALGHFYGLPIYGVPGFKLGKFHHRMQVTDPNCVDRDIHPEDEEVLREAIRAYFPEADGQTMALKTCLFTNTPDGHFIIDCLPELPQVAVAAGFSGHGFKFCSVVGEIMADLVSHGSSQFDLKMFQLNRFSST